MAFAATGMSSIGGQAMKGTVPALYCYTTTDAHTVVGGAG